MSTCFVFFIIDYPVTIQLVTVSGTFGRNKRFGGIFFLKCKAWWCWH